MEKFSLNGEWRIHRDTYDVVGKVPESVYSALLANGKMDDPFSVQFKIKNILKNLDKLHFFAIIDKFPIDIYKFIGYNNIKY